MNTDPIKAKIIELVPDLDCPVEESEGEACLAHKIRLADVLRALGKHDPEGKLPFHVDAMGNLRTLAPVAGKLVSHIHAQWNLATDYDSQTQDVKDFIGTLLGV